MGSDVIDGLNQDSEAATLEMNSFSWKLLEGLNRLCVTHKLRHHDAMVSNTSKPTILFLPTELESCNRLAISLNAIHLTRQ